MLFCSGPGRSPGLVSTPPVSTRFDFRFQPGLRSDLNRDRLACRFPPIRFLPIRLPISADPTYRY
eukprot:8735219-Pyramimonas_sp.AAC.1